MLIFNTTFHIEDDVHEAGLSFLCQTYIPHSLQSGFLHDGRLAKIYAQHGENGSSYSLQFRVKNMDTFNYWFTGDGVVLQKKIVELFGSKMVGFVTLMEEVDTAK